MLVLSYSIQCLSMYKYKNFLSHILIPTHTHILTLTLSGTSLFVTVILCICTWVYFFTFLQWCMYNIYVCMYFTCICRKVMRFICLLWFFINYFLMGHLFYDKYWLWFCYRVKHFPLTLMCGFLFNERVPNRIYGTFPKQDIIRYVVLSTNYQSPFSLIITSPLSQD